MEKVADGVYQVKRGFRAFIVDGDDGVTLIDTGLPKQGGFILAGLAEIGRSVEDVQAILLTHSHFDHSGNAGYLKDKSGGELYCSVEDAPAVSGKAAVPTPPVLDRGLLRFLKPLFGILPSGDPAEVDHEISDGFVVSAPEDLRAVATKGHTPGHMSYLLDRAGGVLFVGDAASQRRGQVVLGWFNNPTAQIEQGVKTLAGLEFDIACFGHAEPLTGEASAAFERYAASL